MVNYCDGKIYKIVCNVTGLVYVGSTCQKLTMRLGGHTANYRRYLKGMGGFMTSFKLLENDNYAIVLIEAFPCENKDELHRRERYYIESIVCVNKCIPGQTRREYHKHYRSLNGQKISAHMKQYYLANKDKYVAYQKRYRLQNRLQKQYNILLTLFTRANDLMPNQF